MSYLLQTDESSIAIEVKAIYILSIGTNLNYNSPVIGNNSKFDYVS